MRCAASNLSIASGVRLARNSARPRSRCDRALSGSSFSASSYDAIA